MKIFKSSTICHLGKSKVLNNTISFIRKEIRYNVAYSSDLNKWFLNTTNKEGKFVTLGEII